MPPFNEPSHAVDADAHRNAVRKSYGIGALRPRWVTGLKLANLANISRAGMSTLFTPGRTSPHASVSRSQAFRSGMPRA
jgi:hypothetical protein